MDSKSATVIRNRAGNRCEYCRLHQDHAPYFRHHIEHILPRKHGGDNSKDNLALACHHCNLHKGSNLTGIDPETSSISSLFNPRLQHWEEHFTWRGVHIVGLTPIGRTTVRVLEMNSPARLQLRGQIRAR